MPPKRRRNGAGKRKSGRGKNTGRGRQGGFRSGHQKIIRASGRENSFSLGRIVYDNGASNVPSFGGIIAGGGSIQISPPSGTPIPDSLVGSFIPITPWVIGTRCGQLADLYASYRVRRLTIHIVPNAIAVGDLASTTYPLAVPAGINNGVDRSLQFSAGFVYDPAIGPLIDYEVVEAGGKALTMSGGTKSLTMRSNKWLYTTNPVSLQALPTTAPDLRQQSPGSFNFTWSTVSTGANEGRNEFARGWTEWEIDFKDPLDPDLIAPMRRTTELCTAIARSLRPIVKDPRDDEEKKVEEFHDCRLHPLSAPCEKDDEQTAEVHDRQLRTDLTKFVTKFKGSLPWIQVSKTDIPVKGDQVATTRKGCGALP